MKHLNLQAVMIDLDGTMVDTIGDFEVALNRALADMHIPTANRDLLNAALAKAQSTLFAPCSNTNWLCQKWRSMREK